MLQKFAKYLESIGSSENTIKGYVNDIEKAVEYNIIDESLSTVNLVKIRDLSVSSATMQRMRAAIRKYARFLVSWGTIDKIPGIIDAVELPKCSTKIPRITTPEQIMNLIQKVDNYETKVALSLLGSTGCRISSLVSIDIEDIKENEIYLKAKGNKHYSAILTKGTKDLIQQYLNGRTTGPLFLSNNSRMKVNNLRMRLQRTLGQDYVNPHSIRHGLATNLLENGADIFDIKEVLNHDNIMTSQRYIHMTSKVVADRLKGKHPWLS